MNQVLDSTVSTSSKSNLRNVTGPRHAGRPLRQGIDGQKYMFNLGPWFSNKALPNLNQYKENIILLLFSKRRVVRGIIWGLYGVSKMRSPWSEVTFEVTLINRSLTLVTLIILRSLVLSTVWGQLLLGSPWSQLDNWVTLCCVTISLTLEGHFSTCWNQSQRYFKVTYKIVWPRIN